MEEGVEVDEGVLILMARRELDVEETPKRRKDSAIYLGGQKGMEGDASCRAGRREGSSMMEKAGVGTT